MVHPLHTKVQALAKWSPSRKYEHAEAVGAFINQRNKHCWFSGKILRCHRGALGSIPRQCNSGTEERPIASFFCSFARWPKGQRCAHSPFDFSTYFFEEGDRRKSSMSPSPSSCQETDLPCKASRSLRHDLILKRSHTSYTTALPSDSMFVSRFVSRHGHHVVPQCHRGRWPL